MRTATNYVKVTGKMDERKAAWKTSRPKFTEDNLHFDSIEDMDLSLNSMLAYTIEMRSSVFFRDLIFSLRPIQGWSLSTRSMPIDRSTIVLAEEFEGKEDHYKCISDMFDLLESGKSRDQSRGMLPLSVSSTYTFTIDHRVLISFCKTIEKLSPYLFDLYCIPMLKACEAEENYKTTSVGQSEEYYRIHDNEKINGTQRAGNMIFGHYKMKMALASQFLRQHYSKIKIGLWNIIDTYEDNLYTQSTMIDIAFYIDAYSYERLMAMRAHWVIDWSKDMWGGIVGDFIKDMEPKEFWEFLPNGGGKEDPYWADVYNRVLHEDPGLPCPIMCQWPEMIWEKEKEVGKNAILDKYKELVHNGFIIDNPKNEHRIKYNEIGKTK